MSDEETSAFWREVVRRAGNEDQPGGLAAAYLRTDRDDLGDDGDRDSDETVSHFDGGQLVVQTVRGELVIAGETVEVDR